MDDDIVLNEDELAGIVTYPRSAARRKNPTSRKEEGSVYRREKPCEDRWVSEEKCENDVHTRATQQKKWKELWETFVSDEGSCDSGEEGNGIHDTDGIVWFLNREQVVLRHTDVWNDAFSGGKKEPDEKSTGGTEEEDYEEDYESDGEGEDDFEPESADQNSEEEEEDKESEDGRDKENDEQESALEPEPVPKVKKGPIPPSEMTLGQLMREMLKRKGLVSDGKKRARNPGREAWDKFLKAKPETAKYIEKLAKPVQHKVPKRRKGRVLTDDEIKAFVDRQRAAEKERWQKIATAAKLEEKAFFEEVRGRRPASKGSQNAENEAASPAEPFHERAQKLHKAKLQQQANWMSWYRRRAWNNFRTNEPFVYQAMLRARDEDRVDAQYHVRFWGLEPEDPSRHAAAVVGHPILPKAQRTAIERAFEAFNVGSEPDPTQWRLSATDRISSMGRKKGGAPGEPEVVLVERKFTVEFFEKNLEGCVTFPNKYDAARVCNALNGTQLIDGWAFQGVGKAAPGLKCRVGNVVDLFLGRMQRVINDVEKRRDVGGAYAQYLMDMHERSLGYTYHPQLSKSNSLYTDDLKPFLERMEEDIMARFARADEPYEKVMRAYFKKEELRTRSASPPGLLSRRKNQLRQQSASGRLSRRRRVRLQREEEDSSMSEVDG